MRVERVSDEAEFAEMRSEWDGLLAVSRQDSPFLSHEWMFTWWQTFRPGGTLEVLTCRDDYSDRLLGVLPMFIAGGGRMIPVQVGRFLADVGVGSVGLTPFARTEAEAEVFKRFSAHLRHGKHAWDVLELRFMAKDSPFVRELAGHDGVRVIAGAGHCPQVALPDNWDGYLASLPSKRRQDLRRTMRRLQEAGAELQLAETPDELAQTVSDLLRLHEGRMRERLGDGYQLPDAFRDFTLSTTASMLAQGRLRLFSMSFEGQRVAINYAFRYGDTMFGELYAFDRGSDSPNLVRPLIGEVIRTAIGEGCTTLDMLLGDQDHKLDWGPTEVRELVNLRIYSQRLIARVRKGRDVLAEWSSGER